MTPAPPLRLAFMGSPAFAAPTLEALIGAGHRIVRVYSQPPRPAGRGQTLRRTPVHEAALAHGIEVRTPASLKAPEEQAAFAALALDAAVVVAYGLILPKAVLGAPRLGCFNLHGSLLPRWRGAAPIQRAIEAGDRITGVQVMGMEAGLDTGPVFATARTAILPVDTGASVHDRLSQLGAPLMVQALAGIAAGALAGVAQADEGVTYAAKITREETRIDWTRPASAVDCAIRAFSPAPGAYTTAPDGSRLKVLMSRVEDGDGAPGATLDAGLLVACGTGAVRLLEVQREGRGPAGAEDFLRGLPVPTRSLLGGG